MTMDILEQMEVLGQSQFTPIAPEEPPDWVRLGWPSKAAYEAAGSPQTAYVDYQKAQTPSITSGAQAAPKASVMVNPILAPATPAPVIAPEPPPTLQAQAQAARGVAVNAEPTAVEQTYSSTPYGVQAPQFQMPPLLGQPTTQPPAITPPMPPSLSAPVLNPQTESLQEQVLVGQQPEMALDPESQLYNALGGLPQDVREIGVDTYRRNVASGMSVPDAFSSALAVAQDTLGNATAVGPLAQDYSLTNPLSLLQAANAPFQMAGQGLRTIAEPATSQLPGPVGNIAGEAIELTPQLLAPAGRAAVLPGFLKTPSIPTALGLAGLSATGGEVAEQLGAPRFVGEIAAPVIGPGIVGGVRNALRGEGPQVLNAVDEAIPPPAAQAADPVTKLRDAVDQARPLPALTEAERKAERARRVAIMASEQERGGFTQEAFARGQAALGGEMPRAAFEPLAQSFTPEEVQGFRSMIGTSNLRPLEKNNANNALNTVLEGRLNEVRPFEIALLDKVFGADFSLAVAAKAAPPSLADKVHEWWMASILSGPQTQILNAQGNTAAALMAPVERGYAAAIEPVARRIAGRETERFWEEVPAQLIGMVQGVPEGIRGALNAWKTSLGEAALLETGRPQGAISGLKGRIVRIPFTALEAMDSFFGAVNFAGAERALAVRTARQEGLKGRALQLRIADLIANPTDELIDAATDEKLYRLFRDNPTRYGQWIIEGRQKVPGLRFLVPFARTPDRLLAYGIRRSPLGLLDFPMWQRLVKGNPEAVDDLARTLMGSTIAMGLGGLIATGQLDITGAAPVDPAARDRFFREGKQPFSVKLPGLDWVAYGQVPGMDVTLTTLNAAKEAIVNDQDPDRAIGELVANISQNVFDRSYVSGLADFMDIFASGGYEDPVDSAMRWAGRQASGAIPFSAAGRQISQAVDDTVYRPKGIVEEVATGVGAGGLAGVPPRLTAFGEEATRPLRIGTTISPDKQTAVDAELERIGVEISTQGYNTIGGRKLSREESFEYQQQAGQMMYRRLEQLFATEVYKRMPDALKEKMIDNIKDDSREAARQLINLQHAREVVNQMRQGQR